jgi:hypothetical protein
VLCAISYRGGPAAQAAFDAALNLAKGKNIGEAVLAAARDRLPGGPAAQAAFDTALNLAKGKNIGEATLAAARDRLPGGPAARAAFDSAVALMANMMIRSTPHLKHLPGRSRGPRPRRGSTFGVSKLRHNTLARPIR